MEDWPGREIEVRASIAELNARWAGMMRRIPVERRSSSARLGQNHPLAADDNILYWHRRGRYWQRPIHISL